VSENDNCHYADVTCWDRLFQVWTRRHENREGPIANGAQPCMTDSHRQEMCTSPNFLTHLLTSLPTISVLVMFMLIS